MNKLIKTGNIVIVQMYDGTAFSKVGVTNEEFSELASHIEDDEYILRFFNPDYKEQKESVERYNVLVNRANENPFLFFNTEENCIYWPEISPFSLPQEFADYVLEAYHENNDDALRAYRNFWILLSMNSDEEVRKNAWWFLQKHGLKLSSSGFFIAYRNADSTNLTNKEGNPIFTDHHSRTFEISIGNSVSMPREQTDTNSNNLCSKGLHLGGAKWLEKNYFGDVGLVCLCNPVDIVALPKDSTYGKMRVCKYIPIDYAQYDEEGHIIPYDVKMGFECKYAAQAIYEDIVSIEKDKYTIEAPVVKGISNYEEIISENLLNLAKECINKRQYSCVTNKVDTKSTNN